MAPVMHRTRSWAALSSFTLVNLWIDHQAIIAWFGGTPLPSHAEPYHTMLGALMAATVVALAAVVTRSSAWAAGAYFGGVSHILLDAVVHPEMQPFDRMIAGNPLYLGAMMQVSVALLPPTIWLIVQCVSSALEGVRRLRERRRRHDTAHSP